MPIIPSSMPPCVRERGRPYVIVFCGVNGVGKSTNLAKIAYWLGQHNIKVLIAACDTFRAAWDAFEGARHQGPHHSLQNCHSSMNFRVACDAPKEGAMLSLHAAVAFLIAACHTLQACLLLFSRWGHFAVCIAFNAKECDGDRCMWVLLRHFMTSLSIAS
eukprot:1160981-Pelagomonas_calceolata.AAC.3